MKTILISTLCLLYSSVAISQIKIPLKPEDIINISTWGDAKLMLDEQSLAGDPKNGTPGIPTTKWETGSTSWYYPASIVIDMEDVYKLSDIYLYDVNGIGNISFYAGTPFQWDSLYSDNQGTYKQWSGHEVDISSRYLKITIWSANIVPAEIVLYGTMQEDVIETYTVLDHEKPLMKDFVGMNGFINDPIDVLSIGGFVREYHNLGFTEVAAGVFEFDRWNGFWDFDAYYESLKNAGVTVSPCIQQNVSFNSSSGREKPLFDGEDATEPSAYSEHARHMYQYAARYGKTKVPLQNLLLNTGQIEKTGLDLLEYYENWNEQDAWWQGRDGWFSPYEYAAMSSADIDGHMGALGDGYGIKTADPAAKMVMAGTAKLDLEYIKSMMFWSKFNRNGDFPADVINFHHYSNDNGGQGTSTVGVSPEADDLKGRIQELVTFRDTYMHGKGIWITEFGYDTHGSSVQRAPAYGTFSAYEVQAMWLIRSYLAIAAAGADKAAMYMSRDVNVLDKTKYSTSGLTTESGTWDKKDSWYYVSTFMTQLGNYRFDSEIISVNDNVWIYKFVEDLTQNPAYVLWSPTANATTVENFSLQFDDKLNNVNLIDFVNKDIDGDTIASYANASSITLNISERPLIVKGEIDVIGDQFIEFNEGWNLISYNRQLSNHSIQSFFSTIISDVEQVKSFTAFYDAQQPDYLNSLTELVIGEAYLVKMKNSAALDLNGTPLNSTNNDLALKKGWNLVGIPFSDTMNLNLALSSILNNLVIVKDFDGYYDPNSTVNSLKTLSSGKGYLIKVSSDCILTWE